MIKIKFTGFIILSFIISYSLLFLWCANLFCFYTFHFFDYLIPVTGCTGKVHTALLDRYILNTNFIVNNILKPNGFDYVKAQEVLPFMDGLTKNLELDDKNSFHVPAKNIFQPSPEESKNFNDSKKNAFINEKWVH